VEVGCGKGDFLRRLVKAAGPRSRGFGFDPSYVGPKTALGGRLAFRDRFYDRSCADVPVDVVICRHVIEHVAEPTELLGAVREALGRWPHARVFFETPCVEWILRNRVVWDFFYEHCSLFTRDSLRTAFECSGFGVEAVGNVFHGQYLWLEAVPGDESCPSHVYAGSIPVLAADYAGAEQRLIDHWNSVVARLRSHGRVALWGAGAKGTTFANLVDPDCRHISCVVDLNPHKQGKFLPGTGHPIVAPAELPPSNISAAIVLNPNYSGEISHLLRQLASHVRVVDLMAGSLDHEAPY
jgi:hypothetical protein